MLNKVHIPEGTLNAPESNWPEATPAQIEVSHIEARKVAEDAGNAFQHRNFKVRPGGDVFERTSYVCTGSNHHSTYGLTPGSIFTFVYPGEPVHSQGSCLHWRVNYRYSDDKNSPGRRWLRFLLDTERCPWRYVLRHAVSLDPDEVYETRAMNFQHLDQMPWDLHQLWMMAGRWMLENPEGLNLWCRLVDAGVAPEKAFVLGTRFGLLGDSGEGYISGRTPLDHEPIGAAQTTNSLVQGRFYATPRGLVACGCHVVGTREPLGTLTDGFHPQGPVSKRHATTNRYLGQDLAECPVSSKFFTAISGFDHLKYPSLEKRVEALIEISKIFDGAEIEIKPIEAQKDIKVEFDIEDKYYARAEGYGEDDDDDNYEW